MNFPEKLKLLRKSKGLSQKDMAEKLGVSQPSYAQYERGKRNPKVGTVRKIANALDVPFWEIADWSTIDTSDAIEDWNSTSSSKIISVHFDSEEYTQEELDEIRLFAAFIKNKRKKMINPAPDPDHKED